MSKIYLLSKPNCTQCHSLKMLLKFAFNDRYKDDIEIVDQVENETLFQTLSTQFNVLSLPALIKDENILRNTDPSQVRKFLEEHTK